MNSDKILNSLAALGVSLLGASTLSASEITVGQDVTDISGVQSASFTLALPGTNTFNIHAESSAGGGKNPRWISIQAVGYGRVKTVASGRWSIAQAGPLGGKWSTIGGHVTTAGTLAGNTIAKSHKAFAAGHYTDAYFGFEFKDSTHANQLDYGWVELSLIHDGYTNLDVQIVSYAWEPNGTQLGLGLAPSDVVPEPGSMGMMAIGAMLLGAAGVRKWKNARREQATAHELTAA